MMPTRLLRTRRLRCCTPWLATMPWLMGTIGWPGRPFVFFLLNGRDLIYTVDEAEELILNAAAGKVDVPGISAWLAAHLRACRRQ